VDITLRVGESEIVHRNFWATTWSVIYAGSPSEGRYSVVIHSAGGYHAASFNLYLTEATREIPMKRGKLKILELSPDRARIRYEPLR